jgi:3-deoxy-D-manno-octulosonic-acid transferase
MHVLLYRLATQAYFLAIRIAAMFQPKARLAIEGRRALLQHIKNSLKIEPRPRIWMHCASLGEFEQGRPVLEALRQQYPGHALILSFFSPSGYEVRKNYEGADYVFYLPFDSPSSSRRFLDIVTPALAIFVKYEFWYFLLQGLEQRKIPTLLIAAIFRQDQGFFKWYGALQRRMLRAFTHLFVQDASSLQLLSGIGVANATEAGDTRFDQVLQVAARQTVLPIADSFCTDGQPVLIAGSTWPEDEELLDDALKQLPASWKLILAPHEVDAKHIAALTQRFGDRAVLWSEWAEGAVDRRVLIVDRVGVLSQLYRYGRVAYIGGGFGKDGIHNVLEAAVYAVPCLHGPIYQKFLEAEELLNAGGSRVVKSAKELCDQIESWEADEAVYQQAATSARQYVASKAGATRQIMNYLRAKKSFSSL